MNTRPMITGFLLLSMCSVSFQARAQQPPEQPKSNQEPAAPRGGSQTSVASQIKIDPSKEADIRKLMDVAGVKSLVTQSMATMEKNIRPLMTNSLPPGEYRARLVDLYFEKFHSKFDPQEILDMVVPIYDKYLSDEEIKRLIEFYQTPPGKKALTVLPKILAESQEAGTEWGQTFGREVMREVLSEHPDLAEALQRAQQTAPP